MRTLKTVCEMSTKVFMLKHNNISTVLDVSRTAVSLPSEFSVAAIELDKWPLVWSLHMFHRGFMGRLSSYSRAAEQMPAEEQREHHATDMRGACALNITTCSRGSVP